MSESKNLRLRPIPNEAARQLLDKRHPLGAGQSFAFALGIEWTGVIQGVLTFGNPISNNAVKRFGLRQCDVLELRKMWCSDVLPKNSESRALGVAARIIRKRYPQLAMLITYCEGDEKASAYKAAGWVPQEAHQYEREYLVNGRWMSSRDANRHGVRKLATEVKKENRRKWILPLNDDGRQLLDIAMSNKPKRPDTGVGSLKTRGDASTHANSRSGSTSQHAAAASA